MGLETLRSYLVSIGFSLDDTSYRKTMQSLNGFNKTVENSVGNIAKSYLQAGTAILSTLSAITTATIGLVDKTAQADLGYQKFAMHMYMANGMAKQLKITTDALGESIDDIVWMPELKQRWQSLMADSRKMETPANAEGQLHFIRDIHFELTRLKVEATYAVQWITYHLVKALGVPLHDLHDGLKSINDWIVSHMPEWTAKVAGFLRMAIQLGDDVWRVFKSFWGMLERVWSSLSMGGESVVALGGIVAAVFAGGPFTIALGVLSSLLLLMDDFFAYIDGRKSSKTLAPIWSMCRELFKDIGTATESIVTGIAHMIDALFGGGGQIEAWLGKHKILNTVFKLVASAAELTAGGVNQLGLIFQRRDSSEVLGAGQASLDAVGRIWRQESGGDYNALNPDSGAKGKYQIMPANWGPWSREAGLPAGSPMSPENQDKVANFKIAQYMKMFGGDDRLVSAAWYAGPEYAKSLAAGSPSFSPFNRQGAGGKYPSVDEYIFQTTGKHWNAGSTALTNGFDSYQQMASGTAQYSSGGIGGGGYMAHTEIGDIHVNVTQPNATPEQIYNQTLQAIQDATGARTRRQLRDAGGVFQ